MPHSNSPSQFTRLTRRRRQYLLMRMSRLLLRCSALLFLTGPGHAAAPAAADLDLGALDVQAPAPGSESLSSRFWVNLAPAPDLGLPQGLDALQALGPAGVRLDLNWQRVEAQKGQYDFGKYDVIIRELRKRQFKLLLILDYGNPLYFAANQAPSRPVDDQAFARFAAAASERYVGPDTVFEIWNEPNSAQFWPPAPSPTQYGHLLRAATDAIHAVRPGAQVIMGGTARLDAPFMLATLQAAGGTAGLSALAGHPYYDPPEVLPAKFAALEKVLRDHDIALPEWDGESGYSAGNYRGQGDARAAAPPRRQAPYAVRKYLNTWPLGLPVSVWYNLQDNRDDGQDPEANYGLLDAQGQPKPAYLMMQTLLQVARPRELVGTVQHLPGGLHGLALSGPRDSVLILWQPRMGVSTPVHLTSARPVTVKDALGHEQQGRWCRPQEQQFECTVPVAEPSGPVYLRVPH